MSEISALGLQSYKVDLEDQESRITELRSVRANTRKLEVSALGLQSYKVDLEDQSRITELRSVRANTRKLVRIMVYKHSYKVDLIRPGITYYRTEKCKS
ncbi:hypothetical protein CEXT_502891 [Caerostris extrusa]|uniref:Uncharacterized protein n=1 Tax=Caerostris extrusa TaxID=172846 RepID=A0AAV4R9J2_CAEEX|nr:hypothetical protein CEXT_502891 [Caerostris extrusa]